MEYKQFVKVTISFNNKIRRIMSSFFEAWGGGGEIMTSTLGLNDAKLRMVVRKEIVL